MTFRAQIRLTLIIGGTVLLTGLGFMLVRLDPYAGIFAAAGTAILFLGVAVRCLHRRQWRFAVETDDMLSGLAAARYLRGPMAPFWRKWLALDEFDRNKAND
ncbi:hypothetical protein [Yoonia sp. MH D7]